MGKDHMRIINIFYNDDGTNDVTAWWQTQFSKFISKLYFHIFVITKSIWNVIIELYTQMCSACIPLSVYISDTGVIDNVAMPNVCPNF